MQSTTYGCKTMILGIDVSKWNGRMNWSKTLSKRIRFAICRAGSIDNITGKCYTDYQFENNLGACDDLPMGAYWYFRPNHDSIKQADYFSNLLTRGNFLLLPKFDFENNGGLSPKTVADRQELFINTLLSNLSKERGTIYTRSFWWNLCVESRPLFQRQELWIAMYNEVIEHPWKGLSPGYKPKDWDNYVIWQYSADKNGLNFEYGGEAPPGGCYGMDLNKFYGTEEEFTAWVGGTLPPPPPPGGDELKYARVLIDRLNIRELPSTSGRIVGMLYKNEEPAVIKTYIADDGNIWYNIGWKQWSAKKFCGAEYLEDI